MPGLPARSAQHIHHPLVSHHHWRGRASVAQRDSARVRRSIGSCGARFRADHSHPHTGLHLFKLPLCLDPMLRRLLTRQTTRRHALTPPRSRPLARHISSKPSPPPPPSSTPKPPPRRKPAPETNDAPPQSTPVARQRPKHRSMWHYLSFHSTRFLPEMIRGCLYAIASVVAFHITCEYFFAFDAAWGISMLPTFNASHDWVFISKYYRRGRDISVGDVVSFKHPVRVGENAIKRVVGMPGNFVLAGTPGRGEGRMLQVPEGHCWLVGDNLKWSRDSRMFGPVPLALVTGKVLWRVWPWLNFEVVRHGLKDAEEGEWEVD
jgi:mitochondrial inner membrane protease subunit 1